MQADYKFWYVRRGNGSVIDGVEQADGVIEEVAVRWFEGQTVPILKDGQRVDVYQRTARLAAKDLAHLVEKPIVQDVAGHDAVIFTPTDFGVTTDLDDVRIFLNQQLAKDPQRTPVSAQVDTVKGARLP